MVARRYVGALIRLAQSGEGRDATPQELAQYGVIAEQITELPSVGTYNSNDDAHRLMLISFDGTSGDREGRGDTHTNPDILEQLVQENERVSAMYVHGVGTRAATPIHGLFEMATGSGTEQRAEMAYREFVTEVQQWHDQDPNIEPHVVTTGFSRGVGSQRHFANLVEDHGVANKECTGFLIEPGQVKQDLMLMYDGVVTGQERVLDLPIPQSVVSSVHLVAAHEKRALFDSASIVDPLYPDQVGRLEVEVPGHHVDSGGDYDYGGLSARTLELGVLALQKNHVPIVDLPEQYQSQDGRVDLTANNSILPFNWESSKREVDHYSDETLGPKLNDHDALEQGCSLNLN